MPGWHEATKELQKQGKLQMVGLIQEQHADRARLFMQWKQMGWPIMVDSLNLLGVALVPITLAIDEHGIIRLINPKREQIEQEFLSKTYEKPAGRAAASTKAPNLNALKAATKQNTAQAWRAYADALALWGRAGRLAEALTAYERALKSDAGDAPTHFRLGVAYRRRYDSDHRQASDFQKAVEHWTTALDMNPNQYIWRRRIQQYGPRLEKPYAFYDWVVTARQEIQARGETPVPLAVEPGGAEFARPIKSFEAAEVAKQEPDPQGRILRDNGRFIEVETAVVPATIKPGSSARLHVTFRPNRRVKAHWNNEVDHLVFSVLPPEGWIVDSRHLTVPNPPETVSQEPRKVEFEVKCPETANPGSVKIPAYALYYVCEEVNGTCLYRRQDVTFQVEVKKPTS